MKKIVSGAVRATELFPFTLFVVTLGLGRSQFYNGELVMSDNIESVASKSSSQDTLPRLNPWLVFLVPFLVYMLVGSLEPSADPAKNLDKPHWLGLEAPHYPAVYVAKLVLTLIAVVCVVRGYPRWSNSGLGLAVLVGLIGLPVWVGLAMLQNEIGLNEWLKMERPNLNPQELFQGREAWQFYLFMSFRFLGLALVVPVIEEMFLRGLVMRYPQDEQWWNVPWGKMDLTAIIAGTVLPCLLHPGEILAAIAWFGMVHWLYWKTKNIWAAIVAHVVTNLTLGIYIMYSGNWWLW
jgi:uncharacterized protein